MSRWHYSVSTEITTKIELRIPKKHVFLNVIFLLRVFNFFRFFRPDAFIIKRFIFSMYRPQNVLINVPHRLIIHYRETINRVNHKRNIRGFPVTRVVGSSIETFFLLVKNRVTATFLKFAEKII